MRNNLQFARFFFKTSVDFFKGQDGGKHPKELLFHSVLTLYILPTSKRDGEHPHDAGLEMVGEEAVGFLQRGLAGEGFHHVLRVGIAHIGVGLAVIEVCYRCCKR